MVLLKVLNRRGKKTNVLHSDVVVSYTSRIHQKNQSTKRESTETILLYCIHGWTIFLTETCVHSGLMVYVCFSDGSLHFSRGIRASPSSVWLLALTSTPSNPTFASGALRQAPLMALIIIRKSTSQSLVEFIITFFNSRSASQIKKLYCEFILSLIVLRKWRSKKLERLKSCSAQISSASLLSSSKQYCT